MAKIIVIADTHDNKEAVFKLVEIINSEPNVDMVLHAGDHIAPFVVDWFKPLRCKMIGVAGNNDCERGLLKNKYEQLGWEFYNSSVEINVDGKIILTHGTDNHFVNALIKSGLYDVVITGHLHIIKREFYGNTLHLIPGEACGYLTGKRTFAILKMPDKEVEIIEF